MELERNVLSVVNRINELDRMAKDAESKGLTDIAKLLNKALDDTYDFSSYGYGRMFGAIVLAYVEMNINGTSAPVFGVVGTSVSNYDIEEFCSEIKRSSIKRIYFAHVSTDLAFALINNGYRMDGVVDDKYYGGTKKFFVFSAE